MPSPTDSWRPQMHGDSTAIRREDTSRDCKMLKEPTLHRVESSASWCSCRPLRCQLIVAGSPAAPGYMSSQSISVLGLGARPSQRTWRHRSTAKGHLRVPVGSQKASRRSQEDASIDQRFGARPILKRGSEEDCCSMEAARSCNVSRRQGAARYLLRCLHYSKD